MAELNEDLDRLCHKCNHLLFYIHEYNLHESNEEGKPDVIVTKCTECDCFTTLELLPKKS